MCISDWGGGFEEEVEFVLRFQVGNLDSPEGGAQ